jgi:hypothetical protein
VKAEGPPPAPFAACSHSGPAGIQAPTVEMRWLSSVGQRYPLYGQPIISNNSVAPDDERCAAPPGHQASCSSSSGHEQAPPTMPAGTWGCAGPGDQSSACFGQSSGGRKLQDTLISLVIKALVFGLRNPSRSGTLTAIQSRQALSAPGSVHPGPRPARQPPRRSR